VDRSAIVRLEVLQTSVTNDILSEILFQDRINKSGRLDLLIKDTSGNSMYQSSQCYIPYSPPAKFSKGFDSRTWEIDVFSMEDFILAGNSRAGFDLFSTVGGALDFLGGVTTKIESIF